jgi:hypothetical protein
VRGVIVRHDEDDVGTAIGGVWRDRNQQKERDRDGELAHAQKIAEMLDSEC